jgi:hypothetical protein
VRLVFCAVRTGCPFLGCKADRAWGGPLTSSTENKYKMSGVIPPPYVVMVWCIILHRNNIFCYYFMSLSRLPLPLPSCSIVVVVTTVRAGPPTDCASISGTSKVLQASEPATRRTPSSYHVSTGGKAARPWS